MKKFNVVRAKKYKSENTEKTIWLNVGMITEFDNGKQILELNDRSEVYQIFPFNKTENNHFVKDDNKIKVEDFGEVEEEISIDQIPF